MKITQEDADFAQGLAIALIGAQSVAHICGAVGIAQAYAQQMAARRASESQEAEAREQYRKIMGERYRALVEGDGFAGKGK